MKWRKWISIVLLAALVGAGSGVASGVFLESLRIVTDLQHQHSWLLFLLPLAGIGIAWAYSGYGASVVAGNNLILDRLHSTTPRPVIPFRMLPLVLVTTLATHLFGGSAGREGTAVQMGGAIASGVARGTRLDTPSVRLLLMCGVSGGFASVFGTPVAGAIFGIEVLAIGGLAYRALIPCVVAAFVGDFTVRLLDVPHAHYAISADLPALSPLTVVLIALAGVAFGLASLLFSELTFVIDHVARRFIPRPLLRTFLGGVVVVLITLLLGTRIYNGLSLPLLENAFSGDEVPTLAFLCKLALTAITLGFGFKGGEVTPLFVIGATLGVTLSGILGLPADFLAALGFVAVFAAAANTPIACVLMSTELFGADGIVFFAIAIFVAYLVSGHRGIYQAQRVHYPKRFGAQSLSGLALREIRTNRRWSDLAEKSDD